MDFRPVEAVGAVSRVNEKRTTDETAPPFAIDGSIPMEDDTYNASPGEQDSALEENTIEELQEDEPRCQAHSPMNLQRL